MKALHALVSSALLLAGCSHVVPGPAPSHAYTLTQIQTRMDMQHTCSGTPCATGPLQPPQPPQDYELQTGVSNPSRSGASTRLTIHPRPDKAGDVLYYTPSLGAYPQATHVVWDFWFTVDRPVWDSAKNVPLAMQALEFDFNNRMPGKPGYDYNFSSQCFMQDFQAPRNGPRWQIWGLTDHGKLGWIDSGIACEPWKFTPGTWHHIVWTYRIHRESLKTEYVSLQIDGGPLLYPTPLLNPVQFVPVQEHAALEVQFQQDARALPSPQPFTEWVDDVTLTYW